MKNNNWLNDPKPLTSAVDLMVSEKTRFFYNESQRVANLYPRGMVSKILDRKPVCIATYKI